MKKIISTLAIYLLLVNFGFSQTTAGKNPVKKVVTSKITKDPKTGKVTKTVTTTIVKDIVLSEGEKPATKPKVIATQQKKTISKPVVKTAVKTTKSVAPKPKVVAANKSEPKVVTEQKFVEAPLSTNKVDDKIVNPNDNTTKSDINVVGQSATNKTTVNNTKKPTKIFKEGGNKFTRFYLGARGGVNLADVENAIYLTQISNASESKTFGFNGGLLLNIALTKSFSLQPEINYSTQGYKVSNGINSEELDNKAINIPVLLKYTVGGPNISFFVNGGPYTGYLISSKKMNSIGGNYLESVVDFKTDASKEISTNRFDYGLQAGAGVQINLGGPKLELEARYQYGLADPLVYTTTKPSYLGETGRNRIMTGTVAILFPLKR